MAGSFRRAIALVSALVLIGIVIWLDVTTTIWQELVILSGLAAGLVTFLLTSLFLDRFIQRDTQRHWAPVTRLALTEVLHQLADEEHSELSQGHVAPRQLPTLSESFNKSALLDDTESLRTLVEQERSHIATVLGTWWNFLSATSDADGLIRHIADATLLFDHVRDASLELDEALQRAPQQQIDEHSHDVLATLNNRVVTCNKSIAHIVTEISERLATDPTTLSQEAQQTLARLKTFEHRHSDQIDGSHS